MNRLSLWRRHKQHLYECPDLGLKLDISRMDFDEDFFQRMAGPMNAAYQAMDALEDGAIANLSEQRMVGHYWLREPGLAPNDKIANQIRQATIDIHTFSEAVHAGRIKPSAVSRFTDLLLIGIGGSCLGPQLVAAALGSKRGWLKIHFLDNTDPDGFEQVFTTLGTRLKSTLVLVVSKSGSTSEPRNGMLHAQAIFAKRGLSLPAHAIALTQAGSSLDMLAQSQHWLRRFPMWDWVGGRTSITSAVGMLPAALMGIDTKAFGDGAAAMDELTRRPHTSRNPAALMALMWHHATCGRGEKDMVILPYKDRLLLLSRYLQQLVMESLGKQYDLDGKIVNQGIAVYGNKGSTDQHAYVQQLRDGLNNFFTTFIVVLQDQSRLHPKDVVYVEPSVTSGDYLSGFWQGTRDALYDSGRQSITITISQMDARALGALIALYERTVGYYAILINVNAYDQPGVEAGKTAAASVLKIQAKVLVGLREQAGPLTAEQLADQLQISDRVETVWHVLEHLAANKRSVARVRGGKFRWLQPRV